MTYQPCTNPFTVQPPLLERIPVFIDIETRVTSEITLDTMTLRQYLEATELLSLAIAVGDGPVAVYYGEKADRPSDGLLLTEEIVSLIRVAMTDPQFLIVAYNAAFDVRGLHILLGLEYPDTWWCAMEGSMCAWPELPGGFSLANVSAQVLRGKPELAKLKLSLDELSRVTGKVHRGARLRIADLKEDLRAEVLAVAEAGQYEVSLSTEVTTEFLSKILGIYNIRDVVALRAIYNAQVPRIPAIEQWVGLRTNRQRRNVFHVNRDGYENLIAKLEKEATNAIELTDDFVTAEQLQDIFNTESGTLSSVRYQRLKKVINELASPGEVFETTSVKKLSPIKLAKSPTVQAVLTQTTRVGKMIFHKRRAAMFSSISIVDVELGCWRAHTFRFSSPAAGGRGLNLHNVPKHDKAIAEPVRKMFRVPPDKCLVRADLANVEFRIGGFLTKATNVLKMFSAAHGGDVGADPYTLGWKLMTGVLLSSKKDPVRQVSKASHLGLEFSMSASTFCRELLKILAETAAKKDPEARKKGVSEDTLRKIIIENQWRMPEDAMLVKRIIQDHGCSQVVALAAYHVHRVFNETYPEFSMTAYWLTEAVKAVASCGDGQIGRDRAKLKLDRMYAHTMAPDRNLIGLEIDETDTISDGPSVRVRCGPWPVSLCWRTPRIIPTALLGEAKRKGRRETVLAIKKAHGHWKPFTKQLAIENVVQSAARHAMCLGVDHLWRLGFKDVLHIHDEVMIITDRNRDSVLAARQALIDVYGPNHCMPYDWAISINIPEISVTESLYESEVDLEDPKESNDFKGNSRWAKIMDGSPGCLDVLP